MAISQQVAACFRDPHVLPIGHGIAAMGSARCSAPYRPRLSKVYWSIKAGTAGQK